MVQLTKRVSILLYNFFIGLTPETNVIKLFLHVIFRIFILSQSVCQNRLQTLARNKHSCLLQKYVNYGHKKFYNIVPRGLYHKTYYGHNLQISMESLSLANLSSLIQCLWVRLRAYPRVYHLKGASVGQLLALATNIRLGWNSLSGTSIPVFL